MGIIASIAFSTFVALLKPIEVPYDFIDSNLNLFDVVLLSTGLTISGHQSCTSVSRPMPS